MVIELAKISQNKEISNIVESKAGLTSLFELMYILLSKLDNQVSFVERDVSLRLGKFFIFPPTPHFSYIK